MSEDGWFQPVGPPDFRRYFESLDTRIPSWTLGKTIWSPDWRDAFAPAPLLCSAWGGLEDGSRLGLYLGRWTLDSRAG